MLLTASCAAVDLFHVRARHVCDDEIMVYRAWPFFQNNFEHIFLHVLHCNLLTLNNRFGPRVTGLNETALDIRKVVLALMSMMTKIFRNCRGRVVLLHRLHATRGNAVGKLHISGAIREKLVSFRSARVSPPFSWCLTRKWTRQFNSLGSLNDTVRYLFAVPDTVQIFIVSHVRKSQILFGKNK